MKRKLKKNERANIIINNIRENSSLYLFAIVLFIIGICIGVIIVNHTSYSKKQETEHYIENTILSLKENLQISKTQVLKRSIIKNIVLILAIWILGLTFLGKFFLCLVLLFLGVNFGHTIASILTSLQFTKGILFVFATTFFQNLIFIPAIIFLNVQGIKIYNETIVKHNTKRAIIKFSAICILVLTTFFVSSFVEAYVSGNLLYKLLKYF